MQITRATWPILRLAVVAIACGATHAGMVSAYADSIPPYVDEPVQPIPLPEPIDAKQQAKIQLGERLFSDPRLSANNQTSCHDCHDLSRGGTDGRRYSMRPDGLLTSTNTSTIFNLTLNFRLFWSGRFSSPEEHLQQPHLIDSATDWNEAVSKIGRDSDIAAAFVALYPEGLIVKTMRDALAQFERSLITANSPFDRYLRGNQNAISEAAQRGYNLFKGYGCVACHQGANVGGNLYQKFGVMGDYFADRGALTPADSGRFAISGQEGDRHVFRVPSLRLAVLTPPYLHDGTAKTLDEAIGVMAKYQLGRKIPDRDIALIIEFLKTLPGEYRGQPLVPDLRAVPVRLP